MTYMIDANGNLVPVSGVVPHNVIEREFTLAQSLGNAKAGEKIMLAVTPSDVSQVTEVETYLGGYKQGGYLQDVLARIVPCDKETSKRRNFSMTNVFAPVEDRTGRHGKIQEIEHASEVVEFKTEEHALAAFVTFASENDAVSTYNVRAAHSKLISDKLALNTEIRWCDRATTLTNWDANNQISITTNYRWNTGSTKIPLGNIQSIIKNSWQPINGIAMNQEVASYFLADTGVRAYVDVRMGTAGPKNDMIYEASGLDGVQMFRLPGLPPFYVVDAKKYVSGAMTSILADDVILFSSPSQLSGGETMASFLRFRYRGRSGTGWTVNEYVPYGRGLNGGTMLEVGYSDHDAFVSSHAGGVIKGVLTGS